MENPNTNCLKGMACPKCGSFGPFAIDCASLFDVSDEGTDLARDVRWDGESVTICQDCDFTGKVKDFMADKSLDKPSLADAITKLLDSASDEGCCGDLTVVSKAALEKLRELAQR